MRKTPDLAAPRRPKHTDVLRKRDEPLQDKDKLDPPNAIRTAHDSSVAVPASPSIPAPDILSAAPPCVDHLKFRIVTRRRKHYFKDVRYKGPLSVEAIQLIKFFEGRCLEALTPAILKESCPQSSALPQLEKLVADLRQVLVD